jgi:hypothetical protein
MALQAPIKVNEDTHTRIRYLATLAGLTQGEIVDRAVKEFVVRNPEMIEKGLAQARAVLATGDKSEIAAYLLDVPVERVNRVAGRSAAPHVAASDQAPAHAAAEARR